MLPCKMGLTNLHDSYGSRHFSTFVFLCSVTLPFLPLYLCSLRALHVKEEFQGELSLRLCCGIFL